MLAIFEIFLIVSCFCLFFVSFFQKKYEESIPLSFFITIFIIYIMGILGSLKAGVYIVVFLAFISFILSITRIIYKKSIRDSLSKIFTPAFFIFGLLSILLFIANYHRLASSWDEFSHWADIVKAMFTINDFGTSPLSHSTFKAYPPAMSIFQYFTLQLSGEFEEWIMYYAYQLVTLSLFMPFISKIKHRNVLTAILVFLVILVTPTIFFNDFYNIVYIDAFLGLLFGFTVGYIFLIREVDFLNAATTFLAIITLVLTKDAGLFFAITSAFLFILKLIFGKIDLSGFQNQMKGRITLSFTVISAVFLAKFSWNYEITINNVTPGFDGKVNFKELFTILIDKSLNFRNTHSYRKDVLNSFVSSLLSSSIQIGPLTLSPVHILVMFVVLFFIVIVISRRLDIIDLSSHNKAYLSSFYCSILIYIFGLLISYMYKFSEYEATILASFSRYISIVFAAGIMFFVIIILQYYLSKPHFSNLLTIMLVTVIIIAPHSNIYSFISRSNVYSSISVRDPYINLSSQIANAIETEASKVFVISQADSGYDYWALRYSLRPHIVSNSYLWSIGEPFFEGDIWTARIGAKEWKEILLNEKYEYVVIYRLNDYFINNYGSLFADPSSINANAIYKVDQRNGQLKLLSHS